MWPRPRRFFWSWSFAAWALRRQAAAVFSVPTKITSCGTRTPGGGSETNMSMFSCVSASLCQRPSTPGRRATAALLPSPRKSSPAGRGPPAAGLKPACPCSPACLHHCAKDAAHPDVTPCGGGGFSVPTKITSSGTRTPGGGSETSMSMFSCVSASLCKRPSTPGASFHHSPVAWHRWALQWAKVRSRRIL